MNLKSQVAVPLFLFLLVQAPGSICMGGASPGSALDRGELASRDGDAASPEADGPSLPAQLTGEEKTRVKELEAAIDELRQGGRYAEALGPAREILATRQRVQGAGHWETADAEHLVALLELAAGLPAEAQAELAEADSAQAEVSRMFGQGLYTEALALTKQQVEIYGRLLGENYPETLIATGNLGLLLKAQGKLAEAEPFYRQALKGLRSLLGNDHPETLNSVNNMSSLRRAQGNLAEAESLCREALNGYRRLLGGDAPKTLNSLNNLGVLIRIQGRLSEAEPLLREALEGRRRVLGDDHPYTLTSANNLGYLLVAQGRLSEAEPLLREALDGRCRALGREHPSTLNSFTHMGNLLRHQGRLSEAEVFIREALAGLRSVLGDDHPRTLSALNTLGDLFVDQGRLPEAEICFREAMDGCVRVLGEAHHKTQTAVGNMAFLLHAQGRLSEAESMYLRVIRSHPTSDRDNPFVLNKLSNLGALYIELGRLSEAEPLLRESLEGWRRKMGDEHPRTLATVKYLGDLFQARGKLSEAETRFLRVLDGRRRALGPGHPDVTRILNTLAALYTRKGDNAVAERMWIEAAESFETARMRVSFGGLERVPFAARLSPLAALAACQAGRGKPKQAWQSYEAYLARGLLDTLSARHSRPLTSEERNRESDLISRLEKIDERISALQSHDEDTEEARAESRRLRNERERLQAELARFESTIAARYGAAAGEVFELSRIQAALPRDAALLGWVDRKKNRHQADPGGEHWACVVRSEGLPVWIRLPGSGKEGAWTEEDEILADTLRRSLGRRPRQAAMDRQQRLIRQLHQQRLAPAMPFLSGVNHLFVLPAGRMGGLPVEVLAGNCTVSYAPSGTMYAWLMEKKRPSRQASAGSLPLLALGDPVFQRRTEPGQKQPDHHVQVATARDPAYVPLPGSRREVEAIAELFKPRAGKDHSVILLGPSASEQQLEQLAASDELRTFRYIHLATHGVMDDQRAMRSALILSQENTDYLKQALHGREVYDGCLTGEQIVRTWKLDADLVTLSGCETALGKESGGEGFLGFSQALLVAGSRSLVLSLWKVDDQATMLLMTRFYENLLGRHDDTRNLPDGRQYHPGDPLPKAEALREAKLWLSNLTWDRLPAPETAVRDALDRSPGSQPSGSAVPSSDRPFANPHYWAAFVLMGDPR